MGPVRLGARRVWAYSHAEPEETPMLPTPTRLYTQPRAPNPRRLAIFLREKGLDLAQVSVDLMAGEHKTEAYLAEVGAAHVPALVLSDGTALTESIAICRYLEALRPEPNLMGRDALETAVIEMWERRVEHGLFHAVTAAFRHTNPRMGVLEEQCADWGEMNRAKLDGFFQALDARLRNREWLATERMTVADITAYVAVDFRRILRHPLPEDVPGLEAWLGRMAARPSVAAMEERR